MKMIVGFLIGMVLTLAIALIVINSRIPINAEGETDDLASLLPDIPTIYHAALTDPFKQAEAEIHDPDIAKFYHKLMQDTGLTDSP